MRRHLALFLAGLVLSCAAVTSSLAADSDELAIQDALRQMSDALAAREFAVIGQDLTSNVTITGSVWRTVGREQMLQAYSRLMTQRPDLAWTYESQEIHIDRESWVAFESGSGQKHGAKQTD